MIRTSGLENSQSYIASEDLMKTVNIAMTLEKPLLVKGEPGTGKTMLAQAIADALGKKLLIWNIKSTTKAQDGLNRRRKHRTDCIPMMWYSVCMTVSSAQMWTM